MAIQAQEVYDVIVVGGGVSGLYTAWRILTGTPSKEYASPGKRIKVLELSKRTGGRLLTWRPFPNETALHGELGGMRFFEQQELVWSLIQHFVDTKDLRPPVKFFVSDPNGNNLTYLRQRILKSADLTNPDKVPYLLDASSRYADPGSIVAAIIQWLLVANRATIARILNGRTRPTTWEEWDKVKPSLEYNGRRLWDIGFWNLLSDLLSPEGYNFVTDGFGYYSLTNNWNAAEAMQSVYLDFTQNPDYQTMVEGYDYLPGLIKKKVLEAGGKDTVLLDHAVTRIDRESNNDFVLYIRGREPMRAKQVVLAMPRRSLELLDETSFWNWDKALGAHPSRRLVDYIQSVNPYPAFKLFLAYDTPWWRQPPVSIAAGRSVSDLPIRQTYYFPPVPDKFDPPKSGGPLLNGPALLMASYDDLGAVSYWRSLEAARDLKPGIHAKMELATKARHLTSEAPASPYQQHVAEVNRAMAEEPGFYPAPPEMVRHAQEQLQYLHFNQPLPGPMSDPNGAPGDLLAAYKDWGHDPYGGGWNFWAPGVDVEGVMKGIRRPFTDVDLYIVGEAYSGSQGWVEGAITTAEHVLRDYFHLNPADWQPDPIYLGY